MPEIDELLFPPFPQQRMEQIFFVFFFYQSCSSMIRSRRSRCRDDDACESKKNSFDERLYWIYVRGLARDSFEQNSFGIDEARFLTSRSRFSSKPCRRRCESVGTVSTRCGKSRPDRSPPVEGNKRKNLKVTNVSIRVWNVRKKPLTSAISRASKLSLWKPGHTWNLPRNEFNFNNACVLVSSSSQDFTKIRSATVSFTRSNNPPTCSRHQHYLFRVRAMEEREIFGTRG